ncbi:beta-galactosidase-like [Gigantopelta aegis]|uniref:beta-galactosidase-like n=1 Tax=Gigantopelta aegis TaxID=1735272 RepID=UPI001B88C8C9|nr:beta-galactosidase-like [Gigantopelta aegis]
MLCLKWQALLVYCVGIIFVTLVDGGTFTIDYAGNQFLKDGKPYRYVSGSIHYNSIPRVYWEDRLNKMYAAGLNSITTYVPWNYHNPRPGVYDFDDNLDLVGFIKLAQDIGFTVVLRPGPYVDAGWDFGGLPGWLTAHVQNMVVRSMDPVYIPAVEKWLSVLMPMVKSLLYQNGGPIIAVQVENEYGSYSACDFNYMRYLKKKFREYLGNDIVLFTLDGGADWFLKCGTLEGLYATIDFGTALNATKAFEPQKRWEPHGPSVCNEFYTGALNYWGEPWHHGDGRLISKSLDIILAYNASVSIFMFAGGTTFGYWAGVLLARPLRIMIPSYDYDAPITESGDTNRKYFEMRDVIRKYTNNKPMPVPPNATKVAYGSVNLTKLFSIQDGVSELTSGVVKSAYPINMENLGQYYGYILYRHTIVKSYNQEELEIAGIRDRGYVMVNTKPVGILMHQESYVLLVSVKPGDTLDILVENIGKVFYEPGLDPNQKGIISNVTIAGDTLINWEIFPLYLENITNSKISKISSQRQPYKRQNGGNWTTPTFYTASFKLPSGAEPSDTFLDPRPWGKGHVFLNNFNLGKYWPSKGPQVTLYVPKNLLLAYPQENKLLILELEHDPCVTMPTNCTMRFLDKADLGKPDF